MTLSGLGTGQTVNGDVFGTTVSGAKNGTTIAWGSSSWEVTYAPSVTTTDTNPDQNGFVSDYYDATSTKTNKMNTSSYLVKAVGYQDNANCLRWAPNSTAFNNGQAKGGNSTYYAAAMYAAQEALEREHVDHPDAKSAIIILGDGGQAAMTKYFPAGTDAVVTSTSASTCTLDDNSTVKNTKTCPKNFSSKLASKSSGYDTLTTTGDYPSALDQCQQSIQAAHDIQDSKLTSTGTKVFSVAYGAASSGCYTETSTKVTSGLNVAIGSVSDVTPCTTMQNLATDLNHFYSDPYQSGSGSTCYDTVHKDISTMAQIFLDITANFRNPRLLPSNTTGILISN
jgi:hypothetical protein